MIPLVVAIVKEVLVELVVDLGKYLWDQLPTFRAAGTKVMNKVNPPCTCSKDINVCVDKIKNAFPIVEAEWKKRHPLQSLKVDWTRRCQKCQFKLFQKGRVLVEGSWIVMDKSQVVTDDDGYKKKSHHNTDPAQAADVYIVESGNILWNEGSELEVERQTALYVELGKLWEAQGLISGATWTYSWKDWDHCQLSYEIV